MAAPESFAAFRDLIHAAVPDGHSVDLRDERRAFPRERGICGDHGVRVPTVQNLCPVCAGYLHPLREVRRLRDFAIEHVLVARPAPEIQAAVAEFWVNASTFSTSFAFQPSTTPAISTT